MPAKKEIHPQAHGAMGRSGILAGYSTTLIYFWLTAFGYVRDFVGRLTGRSRFLDSLVENSESQIIPEEKGFYIRRIFTRFRECFDRPICSPPGAYIDVLPRISYNEGKSLQVVKGLDVNKNGEVVSFVIDDPNKPPGTRVKRCLNLGSYNYLGFADNWKETCGDAVISSLDESGLVATSTCLEAGFTSIHNELEHFVARFLGKEDALVFSMGYGTNSTVLMNLLEPGSVVLSDKLNHTSIVNGCRGAEDVKILPFNHSDMNDLEYNLKMLLLCGRNYPNVPLEEAFKPFTKIVVVVEGIYSMEGECCDLASVNELCKKYKAYLYVDEAHSIGALGKTGRGIAEYTGVPTSEIDIMMGTFSKSFGGMGGYVAGDKAVIEKLRASCAGQSSMSPLATVIATQVLTAFKIIEKPLGQEKIRTLHDNANYFRKKLKQLGCTVLGDHDSPVIPVMVFHPTKLSGFSMEMLKRNIAAVIVAFPATSMYEARVRFCISAGHSKEDLKAAIKEIDTVVKMLNLRYERSMFG